jgi:4-hydroxybenzoate polyprenyltransferase
MAFKRFVDLPFDAKNPGSANHVLPKRLLSGDLVIFIVVVSSPVLVFAAFMLNRLAFR